MNTARQHFDLLILGGGCAGLSLGARLAIAKPALHVAIIEPRVQYTEDRTWCGWRLQSHFFEDCRIAEWGNWRLRREGEALHRGSHRYPYELLSAQRVYDKALDVLAANPSSSLLRGMRAVEVREEHGSVSVVLSSGATLKAPWVIDTRPRTAPVEPPWLYQSFVGSVVKIDGSRAQLDDDSPTLMDFQPAPSGLLDFMYILPLGDSSYLCEYTSFAPHALPADQLAQRLNGWLNRNVSSRWTEVRRECGCLPMCTAPQSRAARIISAGTRGGAMRAATGYAFHSIQRWADACATSIVQRELPIAPVRQPLLEAMDRLFLSVMQRPDVDPVALMWSLFEKSEPDALVRFLSGQPLAGDYWQVVHGLPWGKFVTSAGQLLPAFGR